MGRTNVLVFCASSESCNPRYHETGARLGEVLAGAGMTVVYGGGALGTMGRLSRGALAAGGRVQGIQPRFFDPLLEQLARCIGERFMDERHRDMWQVVETPEQVPEAIAAAPAWSKSAIAFASV
jgi:predicted Rossmann-fold nucleotide-binding protein